MSDNANSPSSGSSTLSSTRQLLDELDALMERMLSLPVGELPEVREDGPPTSMPTVKEPPPHEPEPPREIPTLNLTPSTFEKNSFFFPKELPPANEQPREQPQLFIPQRELATLQEKPQPIPAPTVEVEIPAPVSSQELTTLQIKPFRISAEAALERSQQLQDHYRVRWWLWPLVAINFLFDGCTYLLGSKGRWLRQSWGKMVLGVLGLILLLAALAWQIALWARWN